MTDDGTAAARALSDLDELCRVALHHYTRAEIAAALKELSRYLPFDPEWWHSGKMPPEIGERTYLILDFLRDRLRAADAYYRVNGDRPC